MAKAKAKASPGVQNRHLYTRASYLYQAAHHLASRALLPSLPAPQRRALAASSRHAMADMRAVALKTQIRRSPAVKRSVCKFCDTLQIEGRTCRSLVENASKGARKPWADVLVVRCGTCGHAKRFPMGERKHKKRVAETVSSS